MKKISTALSAMILAVGVGLLTSTTSQANEDDHPPGWSIEQTCDPGIVYVIAANATDGEITFYVNGIWIIDHVQPGEDIGVRAGDHVTIYVTGGDDPSADTPIDEFDARCPSPSPSPSPSVSTAASPSPSPNATDSTDDNGDVTDSDSGVPTVWVLGGVALAVAATSSVGLAATHRHKKGR